MLRLRPCTLSDPPPFARPRPPALTDTSHIPLGTPLVHSDPNRAEEAPEFDASAPLTPRRILQGPWCRSEGWCRLSIYIPDQPGPFPRNDRIWPYPELFCFEESDLPPWVPRQEPPPALSHLRVRGYCSHDCPARGPNCLRCCLRPVMLYSRTEHTGHKCPYCVQDGL